MAKEKVCTEAKEVSCHTGHRERMRNRFLAESESFDSFDDHQVLETLLFQFIPRKDTNVLAHTLLARFGSFSNVLDASVEDLCRVEGISEVTAFNLCMQKKFFQYYQKNLVSRTPRFETLDDAADYMCTLISNWNIESIVLLYLTSDFSLVYVDIVRGFFDNRIYMDLPRVFRYLKENRRHNVLIAHNHASGNNTPSDADLRVTQAMLPFLAPYGVELIDHLIFDRERQFFSMRENCMLAAPRVILFSKKELRSNQRDL